MLSHMKSNGNKSIRTQVKIVKSLLDGSQKSQRDIAEEIQKKESTISKAISYLKKGGIVHVEEGISSGRHNKGIYDCNNCQLTYEIDNGSNVINFIIGVLNLPNLKQEEEYNIIETLRNSEKFIDVFCKNPILDWLTSKNEGKNVGNLKIVVLKNLGDAEGEIADLKRMFSLSHNMLKFLLSEESKFLRNRLYMIFFATTPTGVEMMNMHLQSKDFAISGDIEGFDLIIENAKSVAIYPPALRWMLFVFCIKLDIIENKINHDVAKEALYEIREGINKHCRVSL